MVRVGIIGAGNIGRVHSRSYLQLDKARVVAVADIDHQAADTMAAKHNARAYYDMHDLLDDKNVDAVDVCLPTYLHEAGVIAAAGAGKHILCEKPVALNVAAVERMIAAVQRSGVKAMVAQVIRFWPHYLAIKEMLDEGKLGKPIMAFAARLGRQPTWTSWYGDPNLSGGAILDLHVHDLDWLYYLFGHPKTVYAVGVRVDSGAWNHVLTSLDYGSCRAAAEASFLMPDGFPFTMIFRLLAERGLAEYRYGGGQADTQGAARLHTLGVYLSGQPAHYPPCDETDPYLAEIRYFVDCIEQGESPAIATLAEARDVLEIATAVRQSLETGHVMALGQQMH